MMGGRLAGQSTAGVTHIPDTTYNNESAYRSTVKSHPGIKLVKAMPSGLVAEKHNIVYNKVGKRKLVLDVFQPADKAKSNGKAIIIIHGGGWRSGNKAQHHALAQKLATLGYTCFTPEYRLSTEALYPAAVHDLKAAIRYTRRSAKKYSVAAEKITALGFSAGGELAAFMGATNGMPQFEGAGCHKKYSSKVQAVVNLDGTLSFVHPESGEGDDSKKTSAATYWFGYAKKDNPELWRQASPLTHVGAHTAPHLFVNSAVARMHAGRDDYMKILGQHNIMAGVKIFEDAPHAFCLFEPWFTPTVHHIDQFLKTVYADN
ncbi:MAG: alpha/beta hydrolase [Chitinophagaceae bacterium]|nr:MAG: alpha/beta hydrolase [Chitinophagaceae bacterium]